MNKNIPRHAVTVLESRNLLLPDYPNGWHVIKLRYQLVILEVRR